MSLQGSLTDFPVADVFQLIGHQRKTGVLEVTSGDRPLLIYFSEGQVLSARPKESRPDGALAGFLLRTGVISETDLAAARTQQRETLEPLAQTLVSQSLVSQNDLDQVQRLTTDETIFELFLWDEGSFRFRPDETDANANGSPIAAEMVLLDALRMRDEWATVRSKIPDLSVTISQAVDIDGFRLRRAAVEESSGMGSEQLEKLFNLASVRSTARRVIDLSRLGTFNGGRGLVALLRHGVIQVHALAETTVARDIERSVSERPLLTYGLLAATALLALALWAAPPPSERGHPMPGDILAGARAEART